MGIAICRAAALLAMLSAIAAHAATATELTVRLGGGSDSERAAEKQLLRLLDRHDVDHWIFTREVLIDDAQWVPHSHPVLTINSRYLDDDNAQLATFLHEQFHWFAGTREEALAAAIAEFRKRFPSVPKGRGAARDEYSTYLHLVICDLEFQAMDRLVGEADARATLSGWTHYTWIYEQVLNDPAVREVNVRHGLVVPASASTPEP